MRIFRAEGIAADAIPLIPAGGINTHARIRELLALGAAAVQLGTAFAVTEEGRRPHRVQAGPRGGAGPRTSSSS